MAEERVLVDLGMGFILAAVSRNLKSEDSAVPPGESRQKRRKESSRYNLCGGLVVDLPRHLPPF